MKQGLKIILFVLPQLFALFLKSNTVFSAPDSNHKQTTLSTLSDQHFSNVALADSIKEYEIEFEDDEFSDYLITFSRKELFVLAKTKICYKNRFSHFYHSKLYILYSSLKVHF
jgi:hypothetical protein